MREYASRASVAGDDEVMVLPPDSYADVYEGALCAGLYGDFAVELCETCPVRKRCNLLYEDLQFGSLSQPKEGGELFAILEGVWGGHEYSKGQTIFYKDGKRWLVDARPEKPSWATTY